MEVLRTRRQCCKHERQLEEYIDGAHTEYVKRSALGFVSVYNLLPEAVIAEQSLPAFQRALQNLVRQVAQSGCPAWRSILSPRQALLTHPLRQIR